MFTPTCSWLSDFWSALSTSAEPYVATYLVLKMKMFCCHPEPSCCAIGNTLVVHITRLDPAHCITLRTLGCAHCAPWVARIAHLDCANCAVCSLYARSYVHFCFLEFQCFLHNPCLRTLVYAYIYIYIYILFKGCRPCRRPRRKKRGLRCVFTQLKLVAFP